MQTNFVSLVDHAAAQSDRWLFLALLAVCIAASAWLFRWLIRRHDAIAERQEKIVEQVTKVVAENTTALNGVREHIGWCRFNTNQKP